MIIACQDGHMSAEKNVAETASDWYISPKKESFTRYAAFSSKRITYCFLRYFFGNIVSGTIPAFGLSK